jgi:hypothetical protein
VLKIGNLSISLLACAALLACSTPQAQAPSQAEPAREAPRGANVILVSPKPDVSEAELDRIVAAHGGRREGKLRGLDVYMVRLPAGANAAAVAAAIARDPRIAFAQPDTSRAPQESPARAQ